MGWIGTNQSVLDFLRNVRADTDEDGRPIVRGVVVSFMGAGEELVVGDEAQYRVGGEWFSLPGGLCGCGVGCAVRVF